MLFSSAIFWLSTLILPLFVAVEGKNMTKTAAGTFLNPLKITDGSDPYIVYTGGFYYLMTTTWKDVSLTRAKTLDGLKTGETKVVFKGTNPDNSYNVWAPEIHKVDGIWYIYFTAGHSQDVGLQRPYSLKGSDNIWGSYKSPTRLTNEWGIDGTVSVINSKRYFIWSCQNANLQSLCIAQMTAPDKLGETHVISQPTNDWEKMQGQLPVNEGPAVMQKGGKVFMTYSASYCWTSDYSLGLLTLKIGQDPLKKANWVKTGPVFKSANRNYGPGHNGFFTSPDGKEIWNVYHATANSKGSCDGNRYTMAEKVNWKPDGTPDFGVPSALSTQIQVPSGEKV
ncbi:glycoside hydrolase family 43 protein [Venturia nashicola]|uniref:Glycoside hydrolase family 43 protein n=1 Tax=Venturia nashicola TaxID=86259 RepID=A0A4Z1P8T4_9PEZI|nr:glycoside hydrolase family 43 protein [Venturia nashicola]